MSMEVMPGYKQTEVGLIPEDWEVVSIRKAGQVQGGRQRSPHNVGDPCKYLRVANVFDGFLETGDILEMPFTTTEKERFLLRHGDILLNEGQSIDLVGRSAIYRGIPDQCCFQNTLIRFRANRNTCVEFAQLVFQQYLRIGVFASIALQTTSIAHLGAGRFASLKILLPPLPEQKSIADALSDADALIESLEQLIAKKRHIKQGAMQVLLTGKRRLNGFANATIGYKQTDVGMIPEDWDITNLASVCSEPMQNGVFYKPSHKGVGVKLINVGDLYKRTPIDTDSLELFDADENEKERFKVEDGDLFFTRSSVVPSGIAHCNIYKSNRSESVVFDSHVIRVRPDNRKVAPSYLFRFCVASVARKYLVSRAKTATMTTIDQSVLSKCPVFLPAKAEQETIAEVLSDMDAEIAALETKLAKYRQIKQGMMHNLLTGRIRLV